MTPLFLNLTNKRGLLLLLLLLPGISSFSQSDILDKEIIVPNFEGNAKELIKQIDSLNTIVFSYSSNVSLDYKVSFQKSQMKLHVFLEDLFKGKPISYRTNGNKIILYRDKSKAGNLVQTVRGTVVDADSKMPLIGATITIPDSDPIIGTITDLDGNFRIEKVNVGRINLHLSYMGYEDIFIPNIEINSGKEVVLSLAMRESSVVLDEVVIKSRKKGEAINDLSLLSSRSISIEETKRFTGGMDDPARMVTSYAGVAATQDGSSDVIVRGNSPKYMQWRLDGVEISSPYHMDDQNATFGALTVLNKSLLTTSDFYTGAFSSEYGDVLSNVMDVKLRNGNNEKFEATGGLGLMGTDITIEGPFKKGYRGSYLINYRYSTVSLIRDLGLIGEVDGIVNYQDASFKAVLPTKKAGTFSIVGIGGLSGFSFTDVTPEGISTPGRVTNASIMKDYDKSANLANVAIINIRSLSKNSYLRTSVSYSSNGFDDDLYEKNTFPVYTTQNELTDSIGERYQTFKSRVRNSAYQAAITYNNRINARHKIQIGTRYKYSFSDYNQSILMYNTGELVNVTDFNNGVNSLNNFISWKYSLNDKISFVAGIHNANVLLNKKTTLEPRIAINWNINKTSSIHAGYGKHSTTESTHNYFTKVQQPDGTYTQPNKDLDLLKADHYILGFEKRFTEHLKAKFEIYYQHLYDLPVENNDTSYYATINEGNDYRYVALVNEGVGKNYGIEFTLERFFDNNYYFLFNSSLYESKYKSLEGVWRNSMYNGNYIVNFLLGKEFKNLSAKKNKVLAINAKAFFGGGQRYTPLLRDSDGNVAVDPANNEYWDYKKAYDNDLVHIYNVNVSISYKINRYNSTHEIFIDLMNVLNSKANLAEYYDASQPNNVGYLKQMMFLPNIMYRVYF